MTKPFLMSVCVCVLSANCFPTDSVQAQRWPSWRGPSDAGSTEHGTYADSWDDKKGVLWKVRLPGTGCSTPIVWDEHIVLTCPVDGKDAVVDFDADGKQRWSTAVGKQRKGKHRNGSGSNPSAVTDGKRLFAYFKSGNLAALDFKGEVKWKTNLQDRFSRDTLFWDLGTSPVLSDQFVVVAVMHGGGSFVAAFDKKDGELAWKVDRNYKTPTEGDHSYATPHVIQRDGKQRIIVWGAEHVTAHDAADGKVIWSAGDFNPKSKRNWVVVASSVVAGDVVVVPYGRGSRLAGVRLGGKGDATESRRLWTRTDTGCFVPTPAVHKGRLYVLRDRGQVQCIDPKTGKTIWKDRLPKKSSSYYASPVVADGKLYAAREDGVIFVANVEGKFKVLSENDMGERVIASPVPVSDRLLIRGEHHLFCIGTK
jgi:outer membrane protein assembly factor BamB